MLAAILKPDNQLIQGNYTLIREICKKECLKDENISDFIEFSQSYNYFEPYFDYVMFKLNYIFINPFYQKSNALCKEGDSLYKIKINSIDYKEIRTKVEEEIKSRMLLPFISKCSDEELGIEKKTESNMTTCILDPNNIGLLNNKGTEHGSHGITANTVVNQLLLISPKINQDFIENLNSQTEYEDNDSITYLSNRFGCMRITDKSTYPIIIANELSLNEEQIELIRKLQQDGYNYYDLETDVESFNSIYRKLISKKYISEKETRKK